MLDLLCTTSNMFRPRTVTIAIKYNFVYIVPEDGHRSGPKHVVSSTQ
jgi:hypothetical protein